MNIKEIAQIAGVSTATVSYVINNKKKVSEKTKKRILNIINEVGFEVSGIARDLKLQKTNTIGLFLDVISGPYYADLITGIQDVIIRKGYDFIIAPNYRGKEKDTSKFLLERRIDGAIIFSPEMSTESLETITNLSIPIVFIDREIKNKDNICSVLIDNNSGIQEALKYLKSIGKNNIAFISGVKEHYDSIERLISFKNGIILNNLNTRFKWLFQGDFTEESGYRISNDLYNLFADRPEAIICSNDQMAIGLIKGLNEKEIKIPENISVIGFDNIKFSEYTNPKLTTIDNPKYKLGQLAANTLFRGIEGEKIEGIIKLPTTLIKRDSCK